MIGGATLDMPPDEEEGASPGLSRILLLSKPEWGWLLIGTLVLCVSLLPMLLLPLFFGWVIDEMQRPDLANDEKRHGIIVHLTNFSYILLGGSFATFVRGVIFNGAGERAVARVRAKLFRAIVVQDVGMFDRRKTGELISRLTSDTTVLQDVATSNVSMFLRGLGQIIFSATLMFINSWRLACLILCVVPLCVLCVMLYSPLLKRLSTQYTDAVGVSNDLAQQSISNIRTVRSFAAEDIESQKYQDAIGNPDNKQHMLCCWYPRQPSAYKTGMKKQIASSFFGAFITLLFTASIIVVLWFGTFQVIDGKLSFGSLSSFILYALQIAGSIGMMTGLAASLLTAAGASKRTFQLVDRTPRVPVTGGASLELMQGIIRFEDVNFAYPTRPEVMVLRNFTLDIPKDAREAFVGSSGAGKSTILALIQRFYDVTGGQILLDGRPLTELDPSWVRRQFAFVQQEPVLFGTTIARNIGYGHAVKMGSANECPSQEDLEAVARDAYCHEFIINFPEGYQTLVGERGVRLSGGQKQRVAIARALLMDPRVLLLDEATSALDAESEAIVADAIERAMVGRTTLIVAHRLSTVQRADQIAVVEHGRLVDKGTHDELLQCCAKYQELVRRQLYAAPLAEPSPAGTEEAAGQPTVPAAVKPSELRAEVATAEINRPAGGEATSDSKTDGTSDPNSMTAPLLDG